MKLKPTDYLIFIAFVFVCNELAVGTIINFLEMKGEKLADPDKPYEKMFPLTALPQADLVVYMKMNIALCISFYTVVWAAKGAFLAMYYSLGEALSKPMRVIVKTGIVYTSLTYAITVLVTLLWCRPLSLMWTVKDPTDPRFCHFGQAPVLALHSAFNLSTDLFVLILSLAIVRSLHLQHRELAGFAFVVALGSASILAGTARAAANFPTYRSISALWSWKQKSGIFGVVEQFTAVVACCLPAFRIYLRSAKRRAAAWPKESEPVADGGGSGGGSGGSGGNTLGTGFSTYLERHELTSYQSTGEILADRGQETLPERDPEAQAPDGGR